MNGRRIYFDSPYRPKFRRTTFLAAGSKPDFRLFCPPKCCPIRYYDYSVQIRQKMMVLKSKRGGLSYKGGSLKKKGREGEGTPFHTMYDSLQISLPSKRWRQFIVRKSSLGAVMAVVSATSSKHRTAENRLLVTDNIRRGERWRRVFQTENRNHDRVRGKRCREPRRVLLAERERIFGAADNV